MRAPTHWKSSTWLEWVSANLIQAVDRSRLLQDRILASSFVMARQLRSLQKVAAKSPKNVVVR
jgi:hypothetical protein